MDKQTLKINLKENHNRFIDYITSLTQQEFLYYKDQKWAAGQELDHILKSIFPLAQILNNKSKIILKFGYIDRPIMVYEEVVKKYKAELIKGGKATGVFIPEQIDWNEKNELINELVSTVNTLIKVLDNYSEKEMNELILPHPLLGKLTIQEMLYFAIYHVCHHFENMKRNNKKWHNNSEYSNHYYCKNLLD